MSTKPFVHEYLERVSWRLLDVQGPVIRDMIRGRAGVYALYRGNKLYYVGLAGNLMGRVKQHLKDRHHKKWDRFSVYLTTDDGHIKPLESLMLRVLDPSGNRVKGKLAGARDLVRDLKRRMEERAKDDVAVLLGGKIASRRRRSTARAAGALGLGRTLERAARLRGTINGKTYTATIRRDGKIYYRKRLYESPTAAASAALGRPVNGWDFWRLRNDDGEWVRLRTIRR
jgi:hypothetical protein